MVEQLNGETRLFPIIGNPIKYVQIVPRFNQEMQRRHRNGICLPMQVKEGDLDTVVAGLTNTANVDGLLVTMPHKSAAFKQCTTSDSTSQLLGAVSVMRKNADGSWHGGMLDGVAFVTALVLAGARPEGARALLVGAGAAGSAIAVELLEQGVDRLVVYDVNADRMTQLIKTLQVVGRGRVVSGSSDPSGCDIVCNASWTGMEDDDPTPVPTTSLTPSMVVGDVIAGHGITPLIAAATSVGCKTSNGDQMVAAVQHALVDFMLAAE